LLPLRSQICNPDCSHDRRPRHRAHASARGRARRPEAPRLRAYAAAEEDSMYWVFVGVMTGVAFAWVSVRRRRKADTKTA